MRYYNGRNSSVLVLIPAHNTDNNSNSEEKDEIFDFSQ
nr:MAG TPA: hypothetical protein [Caudoviricetes sp.]